MVRRWFPLHNLLFGDHLQDVDLSQNRSLTKEAMETVECRSLKIPPRSPDIKPTENVFNNIRVKISKEGNEKDMAKETFEQFCNWVIQITFEWRTKVIDRTIDSMPKNIAIEIRIKGYKQNNKKNLDLLKIKKL